MTEPAHAATSCDAVDRGRADVAVTIAACSPASTTSVWPCTTWTRPSRSTPAPSACRWCTRRSTRSRACARRCSPSATAGRASSCSPRCGRTRRSPSSSTAAGEGIQQVAYGVDDIDAVVGGAARARRAAALRRAAARHRGVPGQLRAPEGRGGSWSSWSRRRLTTEPRRLRPTYGRGMTDLVRPRNGRMIAGVCAGIARRFGWSPGRGPPGVPAVLPAARPAGPGLPGALGGHPLGGLTGAAPGWKVLVTRQ